MTTLDLCVVADRFCTTSRTYLAYLGAQGFRVRRVLLVDFTGPHEAFRQRRARWGAWLTSFSKQRFKLAPRQWSDEQQALGALLQSRVRIPVNYYADFDFGAHTEAVEEFTAEDYNDPDLLKRLHGETAGALLYTNGGRVPGGFLNSCRSRMIHIHPGVVPHVRGSDCLFWSILTRGRPGMSCFYMNAGIDTGDIIHTREFAPPAYPELLPYIERDPSGVYGSVLLAYDPHLRAETLLDVVAKSQNGDLRSLASAMQNAAEGRNFYWMHPKLYPIALRKFAGVDTAG